jgi:hypothetical protein
MLTWHAERWASVVQVLYMFVVVMPIMAEVKDIS